MSTTNKYTVKINLNSDRNNTEYTDLEDLIHQKELEDIIEHFKGSLSKAEEYKNNLDHDGKVIRIHDTITLSGSRGSGKTTLIKSLFGFISNSNLRGIDKIDMNMRKDIEVLGILDPTLIEEKGHVFLNIVSRIKEKVESKSIGQKSSWNKKEDAQDRHYLDWEESLKRLAEGLPYIDGIGVEDLKQSEWYDSEFVMEQGLRGVSAANNFEKDFHIFINKSLEYLNKKAFLLAFDDVDTNFKKGFPVLDILHKYLTTPQLITILSGDLSLYSILVRKNQWGNIGEFLFKVECDKGKEYKNYESTVTRIEEQYFQKLLIPERRVYLRTLYQKEESGLYKITINRGIPGTTTADGEEPEYSLKKYYQNELRKLGVNDSRQENYFYQFLANLPIRTQKQLMYLLSQDKGKNKEKINEEIINENIRMAILDLFWNDLAARNLDVTLLREHSELTIIQLLNYLVEKEILNEGYSLRPVFDDTVLNGTQFSLGILLSLLFKENPSYIFEYWFRVSLTRDMNSLFDNPSNNTYSGRFLLKDYINHCAITSRRKQSYVARMITSYLRGMKTPQIAGYSKSLQPWLGTIPLYKIKDYENRTFDKSINNSERTTVKILGNLPFSIVTDNKGYRLPVYSIFNLLGVIGEMLEYIDGHRYSDSDGYDNPIHGIANILMKNSQSRYYPIPKATINNDTGIQDYEEEAYQFNDINKIGDLAVISGNLYLWCLEYPKQGFHPYLAAKIFTRFFYVLGRIDLFYPKLIPPVEAQHPHEAMTLAGWFHRMIIAFLNSVLVEEFLDKIGAGELIINLNNPVTNDEIFISNLKNAFIENHLENKLEYTRWILSCPLWGYFLKNPNSELPELIRESFNLGVSHYLRDQYESVGYFLRDVIVVSNKINVIKNNKLQFSVKDHEALEYFKRAAFAAGLTKEIVENMDKVEFEIKVKELIKDKYPNISTRTIESLRKRITGEIKW